VLGVTILSLSLWSYWETWIGTPKNLRCWSQIETRKMSDFETRSNLLVSCTLCQ